MDDKRSEGRTNVFLSAALATAAGTVPVRIRDISPRGAMVQAAALPGPGVRFRLLRGELKIGGSVAWQQAGYAGLSFEAQINVDLWVRRNEHVGQHRVDELVSAVSAASQSQMMVARQSRCHTQMSAQPWISFATAWHRPTVCRLSLEMSS